MRFIPMEDVNRRHVGKGWKWRYFRGIQCVLATRGFVSPNPDFTQEAFGESFENFSRSYPCLTATSFTGSTLPTMVLPIGGVATAA